MLYIDHKERGRGVFTDTPIPAGTVIEECPILVIPDKDANAGAEMLIDCYLYHWGQDRYCFVFGYGMLYNHDVRPNASVTEDHERQLMVVRAICDIAAHEEITHDYSEEGKDLVFYEDGTWEFADTLSRD